MNFTEALHLKKQIGETKEIENTTYKVFVVPYNNEDFKNYLKGFLTKRFNDESAKNYSSNSQFKVFAIWQYMSNILYKELKD